MLKYGIKLYVNVVIPILKSLFSVEYSCA